MENRNMDGDIYQRDSESVEYATNNSRIFQICEPNVLTYDAESLLVRINALDDKWTRA